MHVNMDDASTLIVTSELLSGGSSLCTLNCTSVHLIPLQTAAAAHSTKPIMSNSTSPNAVRSSPSIIRTPTATSVQVIFSSPKMNADRSTQIGDDDLIIVKKVIDMRTSDRLDSPTSAAVTNPQGTETLK